MRNGTTDAAVCADIGGSFIRVAAVRGAEVAGIATIPTPAHDWDAFAGGLAGLLAGHAPGAPLGMSVPGVLNGQGGVAAANVPCLAGRRVAAELSALLDRPVALANDADCFALAEASTGAGRGHRVVLGVILGSGVGGGLVVGGSLVPGAGEWGHGPLVRSGPLADIPCGCGQNGCVDAAGSARGLERLHAVLHGAAADSRAVVAGWEQGDGRCRATVAAWLDVVAGPLAFAVNLTAATVVPVGGGLGSAPALVAALDGAVRARCIRPPPGPLVVPAAHGGTGGLIGAAVLARAAPP